MTTQAVDVSDPGAVSWAAVFAGAAGAAALSLVLILLGTGLGLTAVSPWGGEGISAVTASVSSIVWITVVQLLASVLGGYLAGRLRSRWISVHSNEVYFRDTAHGFLAWAVATLLMASLLSSAVGGLLSTGIKAAGAVAGGAAAVVSTAAEKGSEGYYVDSLFRAGPSAPTIPADKIAEATRIVVNGLESGELASADKQYLAQLVATNTGLSQAEAETRVADTFARLQQSLADARDKAKKIADNARKASAYAALWLVISLLLGAFIASLSATFGGRLRDSSALTR